MIQPTSGCRPRVMNVPMPAVQSATDVTRATAREETWADLMRSLSGKDSNRVMWNDDYDMLLTAREPIAIEKAIQDNVDELGGLEMFKELVGVDPFERTDPVCGLSANNLFKLMTEKDVPIDPTAAHYLENTPFVVHLNTLDPSKSHVVMVDDRQLGHQFLIDLPSSTDGARKAYIIQSDLGEGALPPLKIEDWMSRRGNENVPLDDLNKLLSDDLMKMPPEAQASLLASILEIDKDPSKVDIRKLHLKRAVRFASHEYDFDQFRQNAQRIVELDPASASFDAGGSRLSQAECGGALDVQGREIAVDVDKHSSKAHTPTEGRLSPTALASRVVDLDELRRADLPVACEKSIMRQLSNVSSCSARNSDASVREARDEVDDALRAVIEKPYDAQVDRLFDALDELPQTESAGAVNGASYEALRAGMADMVGYLQADRADKLGVLGLSMPPKIAEEFATKLSFDHLGRVVAVKADLTHEDVRRLMQLQITPLTQLNTAEPRVVPRTEVESLIAFAAALDDSDVQRTLADKTRELWLEGRLDDRCKALFDEAIMQLPPDSDARKAAERALADADKQKYPSQYVDNMYRRLFNSEIAVQLVEHPSEAALATSARIGTFLLDEFDRAFKEKHDDRDEALRDFAKILEASKRPWFSRVPEVTTFLRDPGYGNFQTMMTRVADGYGMIKIPFLAVKLASTRGMRLCESVWMKDASMFYSTILGMRSPDDKLSEGPTDEKGAKKVHPVSLTGHETANSGVMLGHHPQNLRRQFEDFVAAKSVTASRVLHPESATEFERNALANGEFVVCGLSGSTNVMIYLANHIGEYGGEEAFSIQQALLNTMAFVVFDGGHSINESLAVYRALSKRLPVFSALLKQGVEPEEADKEMKAARAEAAEVLSTYVANYFDLVEMLEGADREAMQNILRTAFEVTLQLHRQLERQRQSDEATATQQCAESTQSEPERAPESATVRAQQMGSSVVAPISKREAYPGSNRWRETQWLQQKVDALREVVEKASTVPALDQLQALMSEKGSYGGFKLNELVGKILSLSVAEEGFGWTHAFAAEFHRVYLGLLQALVQNGGADVAEAAAKLLRSPQNGKNIAKIAEGLLEVVTLGARPRTVRSGYYQTVLAYGRELLGAFNSLLTTIERKASASTRDELTGKMRKELDKQLKDFRDQLATPNLEPVKLEKIARQLDDIEASIVKQGRELAQRELLVKTVRELADRYDLKLPECLESSLLPEQVDIVKALGKEMEGKRQAIFSKPDKKYGWERQALRELGDEFSKQLLERAGVFVESPRNDQAAMDRCLSSAEAKSLLEKPGRYGTSIDVCVEKVTKLILNDAYFVDKLKKIGQSFDTRAKVIAQGNEHEHAEAQRAACESMKKEVREKAGSSALEEAARRVRNEAERRARDEAERSAREKAERSARDEAERRARDEAERRARDEAERSAREKAERSARDEAERSARDEAEHSAREKAERSARDEAERSARDEAERSARDEAERSAREKAERRARDEAERRAREEVRAREEDDRKTRQLEERFERLKARDWDSDVAELEARWKALKEPSRTGEKRRAAECFENGRPTTVWR